MGRTTASERRRRARAGLTLIEMMVVILIIALAAVGAVYGLGAVTQANLRSAAMTVAAASRGAYARSIAEGTTVRLVFEVGQGSLAFEEAHGRVTLTRLDDATRRLIEEEEEGVDTTAVDPWAAAEARLSKTLRPSFGASPFQQIDSPQFRSRDLGNGIRVLRVTVPHAPEPIEEGRATIHFFPGGQTEHAVIWIGDQEDRVYSVELHPLTGRGTVYDFAYEPEQLLDDGRGRQRSEVER